MVKCFMTFGVGTPLANYIFEIEGRNETLCRVATNVFFKSWCGCYTETKIKQIMNDYGGEIIKSKTDAETIISQWGNEEQKAFLDMDEQNVW